jgi:uroporphyrinogen-III decarboxylase
MANFVSLLSSYQVFCGKADPVTIIQDGTPEKIEHSVIDDLRQARGRCIISAGCEITPGTNVENMRAFAQTAKNS